MCFLLETTAALSALEQRVDTYGLGGASAFQRVLHAFEALAGAPDSDGDGDSEDEEDEDEEGEQERAAAESGAAAVAPDEESAAGGDEGDEGDPGEAAMAAIVLLVDPLGDDAVAETMGNLLLNLLPPADGTAPAREPLLMSEAALHGRAMLERRVCSYLRCPNLAVPGAGQAASKRCGACRQMRYDCAECQKADWRSWHRQYHAANKKQDGGSA